MFSMVGRFHFRSLSNGEAETLAQRIDQDGLPIVRDCRGFRDFRLVVRPEDSEIMTVWLWDSEADWNAALERLGPFIQENFAPYLAGPPERLGGEIIQHFTDDVAAQASSLTAQ
jgi:hypothetical protein